MDNQKEKTGIWKNLLPPKWSNNVCKTLCFSLYAHLWLFKVNLYVCVRVCLPMTCTLLSPPKQTSTALPLKQFAVMWRNEMYDYILFNLLPAVEDAIQKVNIGADICCSPLLFIIEIRLPYP